MADRPVRRAIAPGVWEDCGPQDATAWSTASYGATSGDGMIPFIFGAIPVTNAERERRRRKTLRRGFKPRAPIAPRCDAVLPRSGQPCGRRLGHTASHLSAASVAKDNARASRDPLRLVRLVNA